MPEDMRADLLRIGNDAALTLDRPVLALQCADDRFPQLALDAPPTRRATRVLHGYAQLPVAA